MDSKISIYIDLVKIFEKNSHFLFLVGGSVRDYILGVNFTDMDVVTDATPEEMKTFLPDGDTTFKKYGNFKLNFKGLNFDITTLRKEVGYSDFRHPNNIIFTDKLEEDVVRRDITINALYMDKSLKVIDLVGGLDDLNHKTIRLIGNKEERIIEDPLRIIRILRFSVDLNFKIEDETYYVIKRNSILINKLNIDKVKMEINKAKNKQELLNLIKLMNIDLDL